MSLQLYQITLLLHQEYSMELNSWWWTGEMELAGNAKHHKERFKITVDTTGPPEYNELVP